MIVDELHPFFYDKEDEQLHSLALGKLVLDTDFQSVYAKDGVYVFKRVGGGRTAGARRLAGDASPGSSPLSAGAGLRPPS